MAVITTRKIRLVILLLAAALAVSSCAALQPPSTTGPRGEAPYPILLREDTERIEATVAALNRLAHSSGTSGALEPKLQPVTGTILSLPALPNSPLYLPKVGVAGVEMNEEETRESLRRFIRDWRELIGADPAKLSLVERIDQPDGVKIASYEQRPFRYPIRGNFGKLQIRFTGDRRILELTSTCIPDAERIQSSLSALGLRPRAPETVKQLREKGLTYTDAQGRKINFTIPASSEVTPRTLVTYILPANGPDMLEFHLAWEIELSNAPVTKAYIDAVSGAVIATQ